MLEGSLAEYIEKNTIIFPFKTNQIIFLPSLRSATEQPDSTGPREMLTNAAATYAPSVKQTTAPSSRSPSSKTATTSSSLPAARQTSCGNKYWPAWTGCAKTTTWSKYFPSTSEASTCLDSQSRT
jgi:hypothetical protein